MKIIKASKRDLNEVARLFDLYRQFYQCSPDFPLAKEFIGERLLHNDSAIFIAVEDDVVKGFVQLYPSFCSVEAIKIMILYDLYIDEPYRSEGIGELLMLKAKSFALEQGTQRIDLMTAFSNKAGQHLYEKLGYEITSQDFHHYSLSLP